jgi:hypothetical protein
VPPVRTDDGAVDAWERLLRERGQWRDDMRPLLAAHRDELPFPDEVADHHGFDLRPDRPFPVDEFPEPTYWVWEGEDSPDDELIGRTFSDGWVPLRDFGCGQYDVIVVSGPDAGRVWTLGDVGVVLIPEDEMRERRKQQLGWVPEYKVPAPPPRGPGRESRAIEKIRRLATAQCPPRTRLRFLTLTADTVRVSARCDGIVRNVDITPGARRRTYDALVHTFPVGQHRRLRTFERTGVPARALGTLLADTG